MKQWLMKASKNRPESFLCCALFGQGKNPKLKKKLSAFSLIEIGSHCRSPSEPFPASPFLAMVCLGILFGCKRSRSPTDYLLSALLLIAILSSLRLLCYLVSRFLKRRRNNQHPDPTSEVQPQTVAHLHQPTPMPDNKFLTPADALPLAAFSRK